MRERKSVSERRQEIQDVACELFLERGIQQTTMDEIVRRTSLSKGGVYHYYSNTYEILYDIMMAGNRYRIKTMGEWISSHQTLSHEVVGPEVIAQMLTDKVLYDVSQAKLYAMLVIAAHSDKRLARLYQDLLEACRIELNAFFAPLQNDQTWDDKTFQGVTHIINMFIVSVQLLGAKEQLQAERHKVYAMIFAYLAQGGEHA